MEQGKSCPVPECAPGDVRHLVGVDLPEPRILGGQARVFDDAHILSPNDTLWIDSIGSGQAVTFFRTENDTIAVSAGCIDFLSVAEMLNYARNTPEEWTKQEEAPKKMIGWLAQLEALAQLAVVRFNLDPTTLK